MLLAGWTDAKGLFIVYPSPEHAADAKKYLPRYKAWKAVEEVFEIISPTCLDVLSISFRLLSLCGQVELANGASAEDLQNNRYYDAEAIHFIEKVCTCLTFQHNLYTGYFRVESST